MRLGCVKWPGNRHLATFRAGKYRHTDNNKNTLKWFNFGLKRSLSVFGEQITAHENNRISRWLCKQIGAHVRGIDFNWWVRAIWKLWFPLSIYFLHRPGFGSMNLVCLECVLNVKWKYSTEYGCYRDHIYQENSIPSRRLSTVIRAPFKWKQKNFTLSNRFVDKPLFIRRYSRWYWQCSYVCLILGSYNDENHDAVHRFLECLQQLAFILHMGTHTHTDWRSVCFTPGPGWVLLAFVENETLINSFRSADTHLSGVGVVGSRDSQHILVANITRYAAKKANCSAQTYWRRDRRRREIACALQGSLTECTKYGRKSPPSISSYRVCGCGVHCS